MSAPGEASGRAFARAALLGNPSDGFGGRTIALTLREFRAEVRVSSPPSDRWRSPTARPPA